MEIYINCEIDGRFTVMDTHINLDIGADTQE